MDAIVNAGAVAYGLLLVTGTFIRTPVTEALRIDAMFLPNAGDKGRVLNLLLGSLIAGYGAWSLW
ncbi:hypothetical protein GTZ97_11910 [Aquabacterium fontiphilum]|jgi:hypothetical protein|uniref:hypothetical protein n=1 Tax=Aquabacterium fontiphilum TaxID=450365 RepID=UPI0013768B00|nr:hypothetical protein [Aquabacterium fontiphilum]NBD21369.1 hypothetical protein [Aquabacterium fontiphilum]